MSKIVDDSKSVDNFVAVFFTPSSSLTFCVSVSLPRRKIIENKLHCLTYSIFIDGERKSLDLCMALPIALAWRHERITALSLTGIFFLRRAFFSWFCTVFRDLDSSYRICCTWENSTRFVLSGRNSINLLKACSVFKHSHWETIERRIHTWPKNHCNFNRNDEKFCCRNILHTCMHLLVGLLNQLTCFLRLISPVPVTPATESSFSTGGWLSCVCCQTVDAGTNQVTLEIGEKTA